MRVERDLAIDAPPERIWELVRNPDCYDSFWHGITRLERRNKEDGLGARFTIRMSRSTLISRAPGTSVPRRGR